MKLYFLTAVLVCSLTGCAKTPINDYSCNGSLLSCGAPNGNNDRRVDSMKVTTRGNEINHYADAIGEQIKAHVFDMGKYKGKTCTLRIDFKQNGQVIRAASESGGDPALCRMAISAVYSSVFPAMSDNQYAEFKTFTLDVKP